MGSFSSGGTRARVRRGLRQAYVDDRRTVTCPEAGRKRVHHPRVSRYGRPVISASSLVLGTDQVLNERRSQRY